MPRVWLKPFGESKRRIGPDWTNEFLRDPTRSLVLMTGPAERHRPPSMRPDDHVVLHAVGHGRVIAVGRILSGPAWSPDAETGWDPQRWPWIYNCQVDTWVPLVNHGPPTWEYAQRVKGQIQVGRPYAELNRADMSA